MSTISTIPSCSGHGLKGPELKTCQQTHATMRKAIADPHHSARFRDCAGLFSERVSDSSGPQKRSAAAENILNNEFQRDKCNPYSGLFSMDYMAHRKTGKWLEGYVDYGVDNGLNATPKKPKSPKSPKSSSTKYLMIGGIIVVAILVAMAHTRHK